MVSEGMGLRAQSQAERGDFPWGGRAGFQADGPLADAALPAAYASHSPKQPGGLSQAGHYCGRPQKAESRAAGAHRH